MSKQPKLKPPTDYVYYINPGTGKYHIFDHDVSEAEVVDFFDEQLFSASYRKRDGSWEVDGYVDGRFLKIAFRVLEDGRYYIITAYDIRNAHQIEELKRIFDL